MSTPDTNSFYEDLTAKFRTIKNPEYLCKTAIDMPYDNFKKTLNGYCQYLIKRLPEKPSYIAKNKIFEEDSQEIAETIAILIHARKEEIIHNPPASDKPEKKFFIDNETIGDLLTLAHITENPELIEIIDKHGDNLNFDTPIQNHLYNIRNNGEKLIISPLVLHKINKHLKPKTLAKYIEYERHTCSDNTPAND